MTPSIVWTFDFCRQRLREIGKTLSSETGCAVREAVDAGTISKTRYASYLAMYEEASARKEWEK